MLPLLKRLLSCVVLCAWMLPSQAQTSPMQFREVPFITCYGLHPKDPRSVQLRTQQMRLKGVLAAPANARLQDLPRRSVIEVTYNGFTPEAQAAFQRAVDIWERYLPSPVKMRITADWTDLGGYSQGGIVLGSVQPSGEVKNFANAPLADTYYPIALAEKLSGQELNSPFDFDIRARFNRQVANWHFGSPESLPADKIDFMSVVLHEIGHGLGITASIRGASDGSAFAFGELNVYDRYLANASGSRLLDKSLFPDGSPELRSVLTSGNVFFQSTVAKSSEGFFPRLFAPNPYEFGSSISHLDQNTYFGTTNSLMTPYAVAGHADTAPGPMLLGIFSDMGWYYTFMEHTPVADSETQLGVPLLRVRSDNAVDPAGVRLYFSLNGGSFQSKQVTQLPDGSYTADFGQVPFGTEVRYYMSAQDDKGRTFYAPNNGPVTPYRFFYGKDSKAPTIAHVTPASVLAVDPLVPIRAEISDNTGLKNTSVSYRLNNGKQYNAALLPDGNGKYLGFLDLSALLLQDQDRLQYRLQATDRSESANVSYYPSDRFTNVLVRRFPAAKGYESDFNVDKGESSGYGFSLLQPIGFLDKGVHTLHPYPNAAQETQDYSYYIGIPVIVQPQQATVRFEEVALLPPGDGDYAIVEGSADGGRSWKALTPAYDASAYPEWKQAHQASLTSGQMASAGSRLLMKERKIDLLKTFAAGDEVLLRFRLHTNARNSGWGWSFDNLSVQPAVLGVEQELLTTGSQLSLYPNPAQRGAFLDFSLKTPARSVALSLFDAGGRKVWQRDLGALQQAKALPLDLQNLRPGLYLLRTTIDGKAITRKLLVQ